MRKRADAVGSATPDPSTAPARSTPVPQPAIENKPAPGLKGPSGLGGRTTYSRVNTGVAPTPDMGSLAQKSETPRGFEFLPKMASEEYSMPNTTGRPALQELTKLAMDRVSSRLAVNLEASRQKQAGDEPPVKTASAPASVQTSIPTDLATKLASAMEHIAHGYIKKAGIEIDAGTESGVGPGEGPNALEVSTPNALTEENIDTGDTGKAKLQPPVDPPLQKDPSRSADSGTGLETDDDRKIAHVLNRNLAALGISKHAFGIPGMGGGSSDGGAPAQPSKAKNTAMGALGGGALGAGVGALAGHLTGFGAGKGALVGGGLGAAGGGAYGYSKKASVLAKNLLVMGFSPEYVQQKVAEEIDPALAQAAHEEATRKAVTRAAVMGGLGGLTGSGLGGAAGGALGGGLSGAVGGGIGAHVGAKFAPLAGEAIGNAAGLGPGKHILGNAARHLGGAAGGALGSGLAAYANKQASKKKTAAKKKASVKKAEDAINPAQISASTITDIGANPPRGASAMGEDVPKDPADATSQRAKMISSNEAAINYTKRDAKAVPKRELADWLSEPAQSSTTDRTLQETFDHTNDAGTKIASQKAASARAVLEKLAAASNQRGK